MRFLFEEAWYSGELVRTSLQNEQTWEPRKRVRNALKSCCTQLKLPFPIEDQVGVQFKDVAQDIDAKHGIDQGYISAIVIAGRCWNLAQ